LPTLNDQTIIVMNNAAFHKAASTQQMIQKAGPLLQYLLPYSPDLTPIEHKWAQAKSMRRTTKCTIDDLFHAPNL
jgi:transposase